MVGGVNTKALNTYSEKLNVNATNIANVNNEGYKSVDAKVTSGRNDTVELSTRQTNYQTDLAKEIPEVTQDKYAYTAQLRAIKVQDDITGETIDLTA